MTTALYAAILALFLFGLARHVIRGRRQFKAAIGDGGEFELQRRIRAHGNLAEYAPLFLILLALAEHQGLPALGVHAFGVLFLAGRASHAYGVLKGEVYENGVLVAGLEHRRRGMQITLSCLAILAILLLCDYALRIVHG